MMHSTEQISGMATLAAALAWLAFAGVVAAGPAAPSGTQIAAAVYQVTHENGLRNAISRREGRVAAMVVNRVPLAMRGGRKPHVQTFDTFINNEPADSELESLQMAILTSGKAKGTGILVTRFKDPARSATLSLWLPALRKERLINEPQYEDVWFGTNLTYGELVLRKPEDETHELLGEATLEGCLASMRFEPEEANRYTQGLPGEQCVHRGRPVWRLKSTTRFSNWWYDYHVTEIDRETYWPYRTVYFKDGEKIKTVDVDWQSLGLDDPKLAYPRFIYALSLDDGRDSLVYVPRETISLNTDIPDDFWSVATMRDYLRR